MEWGMGVERRVSALAASSMEPAETLRRLETELEVEVALRRTEVAWLTDTAEELVQGEGLEATPRRTDIRTRLTEVTSLWERLQNITSARANKLRQIIEVRAPVYFYTEHE